MNFWNSLPAGFKYVFQLVVAVICCAIFMCIFAWIMYWCQTYLTFLPWPRH